jgi:hypothetical protein
MCELRFCSVAPWDRGKIVEEDLFCDEVRFLRQIGVR